MLKPTYVIPKLPPPVMLETVPVLKALATANRALAELKGRAAVIPNQGILIDTLALQEAKASSEIENIVTTSDALYKADVEKEKKIDQTTKEVQRYAFALHEGFSRVLEDGLITIKDILAIQERLEDNDAGLRALPGTTLTNPSTPLT